MLGTLSGVTLLPAGAGGTILGGVIIKRVRLTCKQILKAELAMSISIFALLFIFLLTCDNLDFAGVTVPYNHTRLLCLTRSFDDITNL